MTRDFKYLLITLLPMLSIGFFIPKWSNDALAWKSNDSHLSTFSKLNFSPEDHSPDVLFFGTSRTMNGIHTPELNRLSSRTHLNLGINWFGHGLRLSQLESYLGTFQPRAVVVEVPLLYRFKDHPHLNHTLQPSTLSSLMSASPLKAVKAALSQGPRWVTQCLIKDSLPESSRIKNSGYLQINTPAGLGNSATDWSKAELNNLNRSPLPFPNKLKSYYYHYRYSHQWHHLKKMSQICQSKNVAFFLLAIPKCGFDTGDPSIRKQQESIAPVWSPPRETLQHPELWRDVGHLNEKGALKLASWLNRRLEESL